MNKPQDLFPLEVAQGERFCNRTLERERLVQSVAQGKHTLLMSPRRYGKTSLILKALQDADVQNTMIDLFVAYDDATICARLAEGVSQLIRKIIPSGKKALKVVAEKFRNIEVGLSAYGVTLNAKFNQPMLDPAGHVRELLMGLERVSAEQQQYVVLFVDEFQDLAKAEHSVAIQGAIRSVAQVAKYVTFIFSGSSRRLLKQIFDDRNKPLYKLCQKMHLARISPEHYYDYIQVAAEQQWQKKVGDDVIEKILTITECHPFYVNMLCGELWFNKNVVALEQVETAWDACLKQEQRTVELELRQLTANQLKLMRALALKGMLKNSLEKNFLMMLGMSASSMQRVVETLLESDYIMRDDDNTLRIVDPLLRYALV